MTDVDATGMEGWVEFFRGPASIASPGASPTLTADTIRDFIRSHGFEATVTGVRSGSTPPKWDESVRGMDTVSVYVRSAELPAIVKLYEEASSGDLEIDEDFDPGEPTPEV